MLHRSFAWTGISTEVLDPEPDTLVQLHRQKNRCAILVQYEISFHYSLSASVLFRPSTKPIDLFYFVLKKTDNTFVIQADDIPTHTIHFKSMNDSSTVVATPVFL